jgi:hypothetical protein
MDIHKPKPWHGVREFLKEYSIIVAGVLTALAAEQAAEALHHQAQAHEMTAKLRAESEENRPVVDYDVESLRAAIASTDAVLAALAKGAGATPALLRPDLFRPADAAWTAIRDSALLPIMPKLLTDNAWKVETTNNYLQVKTGQIRQEATQAEAALALLASTPGDAELRRTARLRLAELRIEEAGLIDALGEFQQINAQMLRGERIDTAADLLKARSRERK